MKKYLIMIILFFSITVKTYGNEPTHYEEEAYTTFANIRDWRLKVVNGNIYKRLYDYSARKWVGEWVRA
ncbi:hypothetical protein [Vagococcus fluvialis]|uniref:hypothetical protein n=1 Tax=Vagococcus fluvialis TaxID=2738 RepID=UPI00378FF3C6